MKSARFLLNKGLALIRQLTEKGFTLVELLIVIALIGVLAVAVLAAINPLEQLNRARDTGMESDGSQLLAATDRYYATQEQFPWVTADPLINNDAAYGFISAKAEGVGVCGATCDTNGNLLTKLELKSEFRNRKFITTTDTTGVELLYVGKDIGASSSVYACWVPKSNAKRTKAVYSISLGAPTRTSGCDPTTKGWTSLADSCVACIPQ